MEAAVPAVSRPYALAHGLTARVGLTIVVFVSAAVRLVGSAAHPAPPYFPDEYLYTAIARAIGSGQAPNVRGASANFPALLEPIPPAPFPPLFRPDPPYRPTPAGNPVPDRKGAVEGKGRVAR